MMATPSHAPCFYCVIRHLRFGESGCRVSLQNRHRRCHYRARRTRALRRSSRCVFGWCGATAIFRALRRKKPHPRADWRRSRKRSLAADRHGVAIGSLAVSAYRRRLKPARGAPLARISALGPAPGSTSAKLQLTSIERVELLGAMEDRCNFQMDLSETAFSNAETIGDLERLVQQPSARPPVFHYPRWAQAWRARILRSLAFNLLQRPAMFLLARPRIVGRENLRGVEGPVLVVANHVTYLDPAFVIAALPRPLRRKLAVAMDGERLESMRKPPASTGFFASLVNRVNYFLIVALFNVFPLPLLAGFRKSFGIRGRSRRSRLEHPDFPRRARSRPMGISPHSARELACLPRGCVCR